MRKVDTHTRRRLSEPHLLAGTRSAERHLRLHVGMDGHCPLPPLMQ